MASGIDLVALILGLVLTFDFASHGHWFFDIVAFVVGTYSLFLVVGYTALIHGAAADKDLQGILDKVSAEGGKVKTYSFLFDILCTVFVGILAAANGFIISGVLIIMSGVVSLLVLRKILKELKKSD